MNLLLGRLLLGALVLVAVLGAPRAFARNEQQEFRAIAEIAHHEIAAHHIPGAVIMVGERGSIVYRHAFGWRRLAPQARRLTPDTVFDLASLTKVVATTTAILQLAEQKRLRLSDPVMKYWPAFGQNGKRGITVEELLLHTSGLRPDLASPGTWSGQGAVLARIAAERPIHPPGSGFLYSDLNFIVLGDIVRRVSGEPLDVYCARHIFAPLGMTETSFHPLLDERAPIAPTEPARDGGAAGLVQDPTARRMGGVAGNAGLFSTADDLAKFATMLLNGGERHGVRILSAASVALMTSPHLLPGGVKRGLGWDMASPYSNGMDEAFGASSYGHTGYTGTALWIDPAKQAFLVILASRLYPNDSGDARPLRREISAAVASEIKRPAVVTGLDALIQERFAPLVGLRVGLLTNQTGRDEQGRRTIDDLADARGVRLAAIFSPEHGIDGDRDEKIASGIDATTGLPIYSLYGRARRPTAAMLKGLDAVVVDLQDAGARFFTYATTLAYVMEAVAQHHLKAFVLDRPDPIGAAGVHGPVLDAALRSFTGYFSMPVEHGMTIGELAKMFNVEDHIGADLTVVPMRGYRHEYWYDDTGLRWIDPSPNLRSLSEAILYPGVALVEGSNISVGRGTDSPFELVGAPWINKEVLANYLSRRNIAGVTFTPVDFTPDANRYAGRLCHGVRINLIDRSELDAPRLGLEIGAALHHLFPSAFAVGPMLGLVGSRATMSALQDGAALPALTATWQARLHAFELIRRRYLLYP